MAHFTAQPLAGLQALGQAPWLDFMSRPFVETGELKRLIAEDQLRGVTSNPTIFDKAISGSSDYDAQMRQLVAQGADVDAVYQALTTTDIGQALDLFRPMYDSTHGRHGFVSLEVSPLMAHNAAETLAEARKLWQALGRPNAMIKIPGTAQGLPAIEEALFAGININVTLLFSVQAYEAVARTYIKALKRRVDAGLPIDRIASVASFFVSRIDAEVDKRIDAKLATETDAARKAELTGLKGKIAIANAKNAYRSFQQIFSGPEWDALAAKGARVQWPLWASVGVKNPAYPDTLYIDTLIGPDTVSTMPPETYNAFRDHGTAAPTLEQHLDEAAAQVKRLHALGIDLDDVTQKLLDAGVDSFIKSFESLMKSLREKHASLVAAAR